MTEKTKNYKQIYWTLFIASIALNFLPLFIYVIQGYASIEVEESRKVVLTGSIMISALLCIYNVLAKKWCFTGEMRSLFVWFVFIFCLFFLKF